MRDVFISYRRTDSAGHAGRLFEALEKRFDSDKFFRDIEGLDPGVDFPQALDRALSQCRVMLIVIGPTWASVATPDGPRILQAKDFVRLELAAGLARKDVRVIPVLVGGAVLPTISELPPDLHDLTRRNAFELSDSRWDFDVKRLADSLDSSLGSRLLTPKRALIAGAVVLATAVGGGAYRYFAASDVDPLLENAQRDAAIAVANAQKADAEAAIAVANAKRRAAELDIAQSDSKAAQAVAAAAKLASDQAEAERRVSANASAAEKAKAEAEATRLAKENDDAQRLAAAKTAEAEAARARDDKAQAEAKTLKVRQDEEAAAAVRTAEVVRVATNSVAAQKTATGAAPTPLVFPRWALSSGGCGAGQLTITGTASFLVEKSAAGIVVSEDFRGSGHGFNVVVTGKATFPNEQRSYDVPTTGQWKGAKVFQSAGIDRVNTADGVTPRTANVMKIQSICG